MTKPLSIEQHAYLTAFDQHFRAGPGSDRRELNTAFRRMWAARPGLPNTPWQHARSRPGRSSPTARLAKAA